MNNVAENSRRVRKALRMAFPKANISVRSRSSDIEINWDDSITDVDGMSAALLASGVAQADEPLWNGTPQLRVDGWRVSLRCFNLAQREAAQRDYARRREEDVTDRGAEALLARRSRGGSEGHRVPS